MSFVRWLDGYDPAERARLGGKNASLGELLAAGLPVPPGFAVTVDAYHTVRGHPEVRRAVTGLLGEVDLADPAALEELSAAIRRRIEEVPLHDGVAAEVRAAYQELCERCAGEAVPVAVRSSATSEDLPDASFAGEHDTYLWVRGPDDVLAHLTRCWSSLFTARAIAYRRERGYDHDVVAMSVGVQKMVRPTASGVAFTLNPRDGDRSQVAVESAWGFGEGIVSGEVTPDSFLVDKVLGEIVQRTISDKAVEYRLGDGDRVERAPVDQDQADRPQPHRRPGQGGGPPGPPGRAALPPPPGRGVGAGRRPARRAGRDPAPGPAGDGLEPQGGHAGRHRRRPDGQHRGHPRVAAART